MGRGGISRRQGFDSMMSVTSRVKTTARMFVIKACIPSVVSMVVVLVFGMGGARALAKDVRIEMSVLPGLKYDIARFAVEPGDRITLVLSNPDAMMHNLVITSPGARMAVVTAALALGETAPAKQYIPDSPAVLFATAVIEPGGRTELIFTAPTSPGVYPYVCTYPGHGFLMYGAIYVGTPMGLIEEDVNIPDSARGLGGGGEGGVLHAYPDTRPIVDRLFMPDCGPAAIVVGLENDHSYVFDAGACRLRYAWTGGYIDPAPQFEAAGSLFANVLGRVYWRDPIRAGAPIRLGTASNIPEVAFGGYRLVEGTPEFRYTLDGRAVTESIRAGAHTADHVEPLVRRFQIDAQGEPVYFVTYADSGVEFTSSAGVWENHVLALTAAEARDFTITMTAIPNVAPIDYFSMNDVLFGKKQNPRGGVNGRALYFDGKGGEYATGVHVDEIRTAGTLALWVKIEDLSRKKQAFVGAHGGEGEGFLSLGYNYVGGGFTVFHQTNGHGALLRASGLAKEGRWSHVALTIGADHMRLYVDGVSMGKPIESPGLRMANAELFLGSEGERNYFQGLIDEVYLFDRALDAGEIRKLYERDRPGKEAGE